MTNMHRYPPSTAAMLVAQNARRDAQPFLDELLHLESYGPDEHARDAASGELSTVSELLRQLEIRLHAASVLLTRAGVTVPAWDSHRYRELAEALASTTGREVGAILRSEVESDVHADAIEDAVSGFRRKTQ